MRPVYPPLHAFRSATTRLVLTAATLPATAGTLAADKSKMDRMITRANASDVFENQTQEDGDLVARHRSTGVTCHFLLGLGSLSMFDDTRTPPGKGIAHLWDYAPYERPDGMSWDDAKESFARSMLERLGVYVANLDEVLLDFHCDSPVDMERTSPSFMRGDLHGIATTSYQRGAHRPTPDLGQYRVPGIERLYLVGPFQYPGGGVFGAGRGTAIRICDDLKINFDNVAGARV